MDLTKPFSSGWISTGVLRVLKMMPSFLSVLQTLPLTGRQLGHAAAVDDVHGLGIQTHGAAGSIHGTLPPPEDGDLLAGADGVLLVGR